MGNCVPKPNKLQPSPPPPPATGSVRLYGSESCPLALRIRLALHFKSVPFHFVPSGIYGRPLLLSGSDSVSGSDAILAHLDSGFPAEHRAAEAAGGDLAVATALQHRSMEQHVRWMVRWAEEGTATAAEGRRISRGYGQLAEVMLEHAQMEERLLFPALERAAHRGVCYTANEEHARDLPMMNGIKEDIKALLAMHADSPLYREALVNLHRRFKTLQERCEEHFRREESELLPLLEAAERSGHEEGGEAFKWVEEMMEVMEATHSRLFPTFMAGLRPHEALQYLDLVCRCTTNEKCLAAMLQSLISSLESVPASARRPSALFPKPF